MTTSSRERRAAWRRPLQLAALTTIGLTAALVGSGVWRLLSWVCLAIPLAAGLRYLLTGFGTDKRSSR